jgi:four helix bundle protein
VAAVVRANFIGSCSAMGSASELEYHLLLALDIGYLKPESYEELNSAVVEIKRMLASLIRKVHAARSSS